jgi:uncharacterized RDD family membrane protein YckC
MELQKEYYEIEDYGGFLLRLVAYIIDAAILSVITSILAFLMMGSRFLELAANMEDEPDPEQIMEMMSGMGFFMITVIVIQWLYYAVMESSPNQATVGKMAVSIKVTDLYGDRISFARATGRHFAKIISGFIIMIGYLMVAFTEKRQGLHDILANTLVLKKNVPPLQ